MMVDYANNGIAKLEERLNAARQKAALERMDRIPISAVTGWRSALLTLYSGLQLALTVLPQNSMGQIETQTPEAIPDAQALLAEEALENDPVYEPSTLVERLEHVTKASAQLDKKIARGYHVQEELPARQARLRKDIERYEDASIEELADKTSQEQVEYIDGLLQEIEELESSPAFRREAPFYLGVYFEGNLPPLSEVLAENDGTSLIIGLDYPGRSIHEAILILQGSASSTFATTFGYARLADIAFELYNYGNLHASRGHTMAWHTDKGLLQKIFNTLLINRTKVEADQDHNLKTEYAYSMGLFDTIRAIPGFLDDITFHKATRLWRLIGNVDRSFPFDNDGVVLEYGMYPMAFRYFAANKPIEAGDTVFLEIYDVEDTETKYIANDESGFQQDDNAVDEADAENEAHYKGTAKGIAARILPDGQIKAWHVYTSRAFFTKASILAEADESDHEFGDPVVRMLSSKQALVNERALTNGETAAGQIVYGALRHPISGEIMELVTNLQDIYFLQETAEGVLYQPREMGSELTEDERKEYQPEEGLSKVVNVGQDYVVDEVRRPINAILGVFGLEATVKGQADRYNPFSRPAFTAPETLSDVQTEVDGLIFEAGGVLKRMRSSGEEKAGWIHYWDDGSFTEIESLEALEEAAWLTMEQMHSLGATRHGDGKSIVVKMAGQDVLIGGSSLIQLPDPVDGKKFGVFEPSTQTKRQWLRGLKDKQPELTAWLQGMESYGVFIPVKGVEGGQTPVHSLDGFLPALYVAGAVGQEVEIEQPNGTYEKVVITAETMIQVDEVGDIAGVLDAGRKAYEEHAIVLQTLIDGGTEVENRVDREIDVYAKGNRLTPEQVRIGVRPERELVALMAAGRLERQHVEREGLHAYVAAEPGVDLPAADKNGFVWLAEKAHVVKHTTESGENVVLKAVTRPVILSDEGKGFPGLQAGMDYADTAGTSVAWNAFANPSNSAGMMTENSGIETNQSYQHDPPTTVEEFLSRHWFVIGEDGQSHGFVSLSQLQTPEVHERIRPVASNIQMQDIDENVTGRVYLHPNILESRVEVAQHANHSHVFELLGLSLQNLSNPVADVFSFSDEDGLLHVQTTDLREINDGVVVEDVYRESVGDEPTLLYSIRSLQGDIIHYKDGHEQYSVSMNPGAEPGLDIEIDGELVRHVTGLFQFDEVTGIGHHINLKAFDKCGDYPPIRRMTFKDRHCVNDQNGFVEIEKGWTADQINEAVRTGVFGTEDAYRYNSRGEVLEREVSLKAHGKSEKAWIIKGGEIKTQPALVLDVKRAVNARLQQITENNPDLGVLPEFVLDEKTVLIEVFTETAQGAKTTDYRIWGDVLEKKFITVRSEGNRVIDIVVGLAFDAQTGEQTLAVRLSPDMQVKAIRRTVENKKTIGELLPPSIEKTYSDLMTRRFPGSDTRLLQEMKSVGVTPYLVPTRVEEYPFLILSDGVEQEGHSLVDERVRPLMEQYEAAADADAKTLVLNQIEQIIRKNRGGKARYSTKLGYPTVSFLVPHDSRGRDLIAISPDGKQELFFWWFEGRTVALFNGEQVMVNEPLGIPPGGMVVNEDGSLKHSVLLNRTEDFPMHIADGGTQTIQANHYYVLDAPFLRTLIYTPGGALLAEESAYVLNLVAAGFAGVQTKGEQRVIYDPYSPFQSPAYRVHENGRLAGVTLDEKYTVVENRQKFERTELAPRTTAPEALEVIKTVFEVDEVQSRDVQYIWKRHWQDLKYGWKVIAGYLGIILGTIGLGRLLGTSRWLRQKARVKKNLAKVAAGGRQSIVVPRSEIDMPDFSKTYGFSAGQAGNVRRIYEAQVMGALERGTPFETVAEQYFKVYNVWRKKYMDSGSGFTPVPDDLWLMLLIMSNSDLFSNDMPGAICYLFDRARKALEDGGGEDIAGFVRKEFERWHKIIYLQNTVFQGAAGPAAAGTSHSLVSPGNYFHQDDLADLFNMRKFVTWYDDLGVEISGRPDLRDAVYKEFIKDLQVLVDGRDEERYADGRIKSEEVAGIRRLIRGGKATYQQGDDIPEGKKVGDLTHEAHDKNFMHHPRAPSIWEILRLRNWLKRQRAYLRYIKFFKDAQRGRWRIADDDFSFNGADKEEANRRIQGKPLTAKTSSDLQTGKGRLPEFMKLLNSAFPVLRNQSKALFIPTALTAVGLSMALVQAGIITVSAAAAGIGVVALAGVVAYRVTGVLLERHVNKKAFGKPPSYHDGFKKVSSTSGQKVYRAMFWGFYGVTKVAVNAFLFFFYLIPVKEIWGAKWMVSGINLNPILLALSFALVAAFSYFLDSFAICDYLTGIFVHLRQKHLGLGTIKTRRDVQLLQRHGALEDLIDAKLLPQGIGLTPERRNVARQRMYEFIADQMLKRSDVSYEEWKRVRAGDFGKLQQPHIHKRAAVFLNSLHMDSPEMPHFDKIKTATFMTPLFGEDVIYAYDEPSMDTSLDALLNTGITNLGNIVAKSKIPWANFMERMRLENKASEEELSRMAGLLRDRGKLGALNPDLEMEVRLWASYKNQPFARTLDGQMNYVRWLRIYARICHPDWSTDQINQAVNHKVQILWADQLWDQVLVTADAENRLKKSDSLGLLKLYKHWLGFDVEIASLQRRNGKFYRILSVYDETTGSTRDVDADPQPLTQDIAILGEGKPGNQMSALSFARGEGLFTFDMNQDFTPEQAMKVPILLQELDDPDIGIVDYPEVIDSGRLSKVGAVHAVFDRTFSVSQKEHMHMMGCLFHYGHPSLWRTAAAKSVGGVSSTTHVNEDIIGGEAVVARGWKIINRQYIEAIKLREISLQGFEGVNRKYGMGGTQQTLCRQMKRTMSFLGWGGAMAHYFVGPGFYIKQSVVVPTLFLYATSVMFLGVSLFAAFPSAALVAAAGLFAMGQAIVLKAYLLFVMEDGFIPGSKGFFKLWFYMAPIAMWNGASEFFGSFLPIMGVAKYVATGRGFNLHHMRMDRFIEAYGDKTIVPGVVGSAMAVASIVLWANATLVLSTPFIAMFLSMMIVPFALIQGAFMRDGISHRTVSNLFATDFRSMKKLFTDNFQFVKMNRQYGRLFREIPIYAISSIAWLALLGPSAFWSYLKSRHPA